MARGSMNNGRVNALEYLKAVQNAASERNSISSSRSIFQFSFLIYSMRRLALIAANSATNEKKCEVVWPLQPASRETLSCIFVRMHYISEFALLRTPVTSRSANIQKFLYNFYHLYFLSRVSVYRNSAKLRYIYFFLSLVLFNGRVAGATDINLMLNNIKRYVEPLFGSNSDEKQEV